MHTHKHDIMRMSVFINQRVLKDFSYFTGVDIYFRNKSIIAEKLIGPKLIALKGSLYTYVAEYIFLVFSYIQYYLLENCFE
jgi:hypothetical protein